MNRVVTSRGLAVILGMVCGGSHATDIVNRPTLAIDGATAVAGAAIRHAHDHAAPGAAIGATACIASACW